VLVIGKYKAGKLTAHHYGIKSISLDFFWGDRSKDTAIMQFIQILLYTVFCVVY
jgi:hypothetical protein